MNVVQEGTEVGEGFDNLMTLMVCRHSQRHDHFVSRVPPTVDAQGVASYLDLNAAQDLPPRTHEQHLQDSPITRVGQFGAQELGRAMAQAGVKIDLLVASPMFQCFNFFQCLMTTKSQHDGYGKAERPPLTGG